MFAKMPGVRLLFLLLMPLSTSAQVATSDFDPRIPPGDAARREIDEALLRQVLAAWAETEIQTRSIVTRGVYHHEYFDRSLRPERIEMTFTFARKWDDHGLAIMEEQRDEEWNGAAWVCTPGYAVQLARDRPDQAWVLVNFQAPNPLPLVDVEAVTGRDYSRLPYMAWFRPVSDRLADASCRLIQVERTSEEARQLVALKFENTETRSGFPQGRLSIEMTLDATRHFAPIVTKAHIRQVRAEQECEFEEVSGVHLPKHIVVRSFRAHATKPTREERYDFHSQELTEPPPTIFSLNAFGLPEIASGTARSRPIVGYLLVIGIVALLLAWWSKQR